MTTKKIDDEIVISGVSGVFPCSRNIKEFEANLYNKVNMVNDDESRWKHTDPKIPKYCGKIGDLGKFDATFFGVHQLQADNMDPQNRILIEEAFKAVMDAGLNPFSLRGSNTGVYIGACISESESYLFFDSAVPSGFGITGCSKAMFANRISYILGLTGPSLICDTACSSSMYAFDMAYRALKNGEIDAAIVGASNLCLHPNIARQFYLLGVLAMGFCCPFDREAGGYTRSEAISCIFLQKRSAAKRIYASVIYSDTNCDGYKPEGITYPSSSLQEKLIKQVYSNVKIDINDVGYFEAHSTGTVVGDPQECKAIDNAVCINRKELLLVGSVKSNCGHAEAASGMCSLAKVIITFQNNLIPPNVNFHHLREEIIAFKEGRLKVVTEPTRLLKPYIGINSFGFGGANAHALLKQLEKVKAEKHKIKDSLPRLVTWSSRTEENLKAFLTDLENKPLDEEYLALVHSAQTGGIKGMVFRGYTILKSADVDSNPTVCAKNFQHNGGIKRPLVWVFSGMGSQWAGMGRSLMQVPLINQSIQRSHQTLKPTGLDLIKIISTNEGNIFDNILHSFVGIAAIQIALVDLLRELGISPDFVIGHSVGELGCAYADNCFTAEQMILAAYYRGKVSVEMSKIRGSMAAIGLGFKDIKPILPETIEVACHNSVDSCTISGPCEDVAKFVKLLTSKNIFAREVQCSNIAYHSRYIAHFGPELLKYLKQIIPNPQARSNKWISTSVPRSQWLQNGCKYSSAEYHTNNLLSSVLFEEAATYIPKNAITIEIAPHALLQSILKTTVLDGIHIGLTKRAVDDSTLFLLNAIGSMYVSGIELNAEKLYSEVKWPVSRGTPSLSHLIDFDHSQDYFVYKYIDNSVGSGKLSFTLNPKEKHEFLMGHKIDGRVLVPGTFYLECVWRTFAALKGTANFDTVPIEFENVRFMRATTLSSHSDTKLTVVIQKGSGVFEVTESNSLVASGVVHDIVGKSSPNQTVSNKSQESVSLEKNDFYKELKLRGYHYSGDFKGVEIALGDGSYGKVKWTQNWVTFMDCMLQMGIIGEDSRSLMLPTGIRSVKIYPQYHQNLFESECVAEVFTNTTQKKICSGGIEFCGLKASTVQRSKAPGDPVLENYQFISHFPAPALRIDDIARCCIQLVLENQPKYKLQIVELEPDSQKSPLLNKLMQAVEDLPAINGNYVLYHKSEENKDDETNGMTHIYTIEELKATCGNIIVMTSNDIKQNGSIIENMEPKSFLIIRERNDLIMEEFIPPQDFVPVAFFPTEFETIVLVHKVDSVVFDDMKFLKVSSSDFKFQWIQELQNMIQISKNIILITQNEKFNGVMGLINCLRKEPETSNIKCVFIDDPEAPPFDINVPIYAKQLKLGLSLNVFRKGSWGTYRHLLLSQEYPSTTRSDHIYGNMYRIGDLSSLQWRQGPLTKQDHEIKVAYSSLNFRDIMLASGRLPINILGSRIQQKNVFGFEYSGIELKSGKPVMGMVYKSAVASHLGEKSLMTWEVPQNWSLREAATVPVVYITVYYAYFFTVDIRKGKSILIHAGSGGVGIAAIRVALAYELEVYTTVSTAEKKSFLLKTFPNLKENNIGNSRDTSFEDMIMERTNGNGVDFVLNSLSEDKLKASVRCLGKRGHFLEIGKFDMANDNSLGLGEFLNELSFHAVMADNLLTADKDLVQKIIGHIKKDIKSGIIIPLPSTVFLAHEIEQAFRFLMSGKHIGKVLLQIREDPESDISLPVSVLPEIYFHPNLVYIVPGGLGGFGLELVDWMILRGARKIVLSSSRGISNDYQKLRISLWEKYSCHIGISTSDIGTEKGCLELIAESTRLGPVGGIFNLAVILKDAIFSNQNSELFLESFKPKAFATIYLDKISRQLCPKLQHFVIFSSVSCGRGNAGQTNYGMANSIMERIIEDRVAHGLPGKAIQWGSVGEVGLVAEMAAGKIDLEIGGTLQQRISSCLEVLDVLLSSSDPIVSSMVVAEKKAEIAGLSPVEFVLNILSIRDIKSVSLNATLPELGMDSLMGVEIKQVLERDYGIILSAADLRSLTFEKLIKLHENSEKNSAETKATDLNDDFTANLRLLHFNVRNNYMSMETFDPINNLQEGIPVIIFSGIDGLSGESWQNLGNSLKFPSYVLQIQRNVVFENIEDILQFAYQNIIKFLVERNTKKFQIVAYSFGAMIAHMTLGLLEKAGYEGKVIFIDGSPGWVESLIGATKGAKEGWVEKVTLQTIINILVPEISPKEIERDLSDKYFKEDWWQYLRDTLRKHKFENINYLIEYIETILIKIKIMDNSETFKSTQVVQSQILLIKPSVPTIRNIDTFYGLEPFSRQEIHTEVLEGNHQTILENPKLSDIINNYFS